jgi:hypothetical protein
LILDAPLLCSATLRHHQFVEQAAQHFERFTIIDSMPFMKAVYRQAFDLDADKSRWVKSLTLAGQPIDSILADNLAGYSSYLECRAVAAKKNKYADSRISIPSA